MSPIRRNVKKEFDKVTVKQAREERNVKVTQD